MNETDDDYTELGRTIRQSRIALLGDLKQLNTGTLPTDEEYLEWVNMSEEAFKKEEQKHLENFFQNTKLGKTQFNSLVKERTKLASKRSTVLKWTVLFQILGLLLTQLGTVLELKFRPKA